MSYKTISIPEGLINEVKVLVNKRSDLGFTSTAEFVKEAIRDNLKKYSQE